MSPFKFEIITLSTDRHFNFYFSLIKDFCKKAVSETKLPETKRNMGVEKWEENTACLLYRIYIKRKFHNENGCFNLLFFDGVLVVISGVERSEFEPNDIVIFAKRTYILKEYRNMFLYHDYLFLPQVEWAKSIGAQLGIITINQYQEKTLLPRFLRSIVGKSVTLSNRSKQQHFNNLEYHPTLLLICNEYQHVFKYSIIEQYNWDCTELEFKNE